MYHIFPRRIREMLRDFPWYREDLEEIRLRVGQTPRFFYGNARGGETPLDTALTADDMREMYEYLCGYSKYAYSGQIRQGFLALEGGIRVGLAGQENSDPMFYNIRVPRQKKGCGENVLPYLLKDARPETTVRIYHTLILSPPGAGKTTLLRDLIRLLSLAGIGNIAVIDERYELAACHGGVPQNDLGATTDVYAGFDKERGCMQAVRTMGPQLLAVDEIGGSGDGEILSYAMRCGVQLLATMHGADIEGYAWQRKRAPFAELDFERIVEVEVSSRGRRYRIFEGTGKELCVVS